MTNKLYHELLEFVVAYGMCIVPVLMVGLFCLLAAKVRNHQHIDWIRRGKDWQDYELLAICLIYWFSLMIIQGVFMAQLKNTSLHGYEFVLTSLALLPIAILWQCYESGGKLWPTISARSIAIACFAWIIVVPILNGINLLCNLILHWIDSQPITHPLTQLSLNGSLVKQLLFVCSVSIASPILEELLFRGVIMRWAIHRIYRSWILIGLSGLLTIVMTINDIKNYPLFTMWAVVAMSLFIIESIHRPRWWSHQIGLGIVSSALLFALAHGSVWPTPIPLFVFGIILGYLTARTGSIVTSVILHGLFNLVSCIILLRNIG